MSPREPRELLDPRDAVGGAPTKRPFRRYGNLEHVSRILPRVVTQLKRRAAVESVVTLARVAPR